jgi:serine phosphatase RsbU (regulator of sigma subunit)
MNEKLMNRIPIFSSLPESEIANLRRIMKPVSLSAGMVLFREGEPGRSLYVVVQGHLEVIKSLGTQDERRLGINNPGDCIGEMSLLDPDGKRTASVRTVSQVRLLEMTREDFDGLLLRRPVVAYEIARALSLRLRDADNATIRDLREKNRQLSLAYHQLKTAQAQLIEKERMERELEVARDIQLGILPRTLPEVDHFDFGAQILPARTVGGDFFDFIPLSDGFLGVAIGDVSGKGVPAAIFMSMTKSLLRAEARQAKSPKEALKRLNWHLLEMNDAGMFATVLYGVLNYVSGDLVYARAGHSLPVFCTADGTAKILEKAPGQPLGLFDSPELNDQVVQIIPGSFLLFYTDGVTEAMSSEREQYGTGRLLEAVSTGRCLSAQQMCLSLLKDLEVHQGSAPHHDDIAIVAIHHGSRGC